METKVEIEKYPRKFTPDEISLQEGEIGAVLEVTIKRADGSLKEHWAKQSESFVRQFLDLLYVQMSMVPESSPVFIRDINNVLVDIACGQRNFACEALVNDDTYSIVVGTGTTMPTINDYKIETKIAHGSGATQLQHSLVTFGLPTSNATQSHFTITRDFSNASGSDITVNEIGLYVKGDIALAINSSGGDRLNTLFLAIRDVIVGGIVIGNGETLTINYRLLSQI
jgi:hypothetical protein